MTQEQKELLLKDLCARLPYGVRGKVKVDTVVPYKYDTYGLPVETTFDVDVELLRIDAGNDEIFVSTFDNNEDLENYIEECQIDGTPWTIEEFTPYLRSMSSMTEEEYKEFKACHCVYDLHPDFQPMMCTIMNERNMFDWLDKNDFDYRGLIPKGLAIDVTKENNPYKK